MNAQARFGSRMPRLKDAGLACLILILLSGLALLLGIPMIEIHPVDLRPSPASQAGTKAKTRSNDWLAKCAAKSSTV